MEFFMALITSGILGTLFGALSAGWQLWVNKKHEKEMAKLQLEQLKQEYAYKMEVTKLELQSFDKRAQIEADTRVQESADKLSIAELDAETKAYEAAMNNDEAKYSNKTKLGKFGNFVMVMVDAWRGIIRPSITSWSMVLITYMLWLITPMLPTLPEADKVHVVTLVLNIVTFIASKAIVYWFGSRGQEISDYIFGKGKSKK